MVDSRTNYDIEIRAVGKSIFAHNPNDKVAEAGVPYIFGRNARFATQRIARSCFAHLPLKTRQLINAALFSPLERFFAFGLAGQHSIMHKQLRTERFRVFS